ASLEASSRPATVVATPDPAAFATLAATRGWGLAGDPGGYAVTGATAAEIGDAAAAAGIVLHQLASRAGTLESAFLALTEGRGLAS
ncbi:MAG: hypothetical protein LBK72_07515, partial [Bifidobacteriaceae bacterium]|nr:hypothetical protein [Bifidobacteriaceae bacterium]